MTLRLCGRCWPRLVFECLLGLVSRRLCRRHYRPAAKREVLAKALWRFGCYSTLVLPTSPPLRGGVWIVLPDKLMLCSESYYY